MMTGQIQTSKLILVVDDEQPILRFLKIKLKSAGYDVFATSDGMEALKVAESKEPSVVLLDILMPGMDGFTLLQKLRTFSQVPVIVLSARTAAIEKALSLGANDFISKPFNPDDLLRRIAVLTNHKKETATSNM